MTGSGTAAALVTENTASEVTAERLALREELRQRGRRAVPALPRTSTGASSTASAAYPEEFVAALTEAGFLGRADPGGVRRARPRRRPRRRSSSRRSTGPAATPPPATRRCTRWARCCGTAPTSRSSSYLPRHRQRRAAPAGVRRHRAEHRLRHDPLAHDRRPQRRPLRRQRPEDLHLARRSTPT